MAAKQKEWAKRKKIYRELVAKGDVPGLQEVLARQEAKAEKAKKRGKSQDYIDYKVAKTEWTKVSHRAA
jgi:hypothetical protein